MDVKNDKFTLSVTWFEPFRTEALAVAKEMQEKGLTEMRIPSDMVIFSLARECSPKFKALKDENGKLLFPIDEKGFEDYWLVMGEI